MSTWRFNETAACGSWSKAVTNYFPLIIRLGNNKVYNLLFSIYKMRVAVFQTLKNNKSCWTSTDSKSRAHYDMSVRTTMISNQSGRVVPASYVLLFFYSMARDHGYVSQLCSHFILWHALNVRLIYLTYNFQNYLPF